jgi:DNA/RNA-binding domain of Phe-tRNA-synthetase-like protein
MYRRIGWEPTQYRPSSEALVRRILKGKGLYRINNLVDYGNIVSASFFLSMGLYDFDKIEGNIVLDVGKPSEEYEGISKSRIHAEGKLILRDSRGIFGNPTADSLRTSITLNTKRALALFFCPPEVSDDYINSTLASLATHYNRFSEGDITTDIIEF